MDIEAYLGAIIPVAFTFAPDGWAICNGQLLQINEYEALFNLLGTTYGGDGQQTFGLPDLRSRIPVGQGKGPNMQNAYTFASQGGVETAMLSVGTMPPHTHPASLQCNAQTGSAGTPVNNVYAGALSAVDTPYAQQAGATMNAATVSVSAAGTSSPTSFSLVQPFVAINYLICTQGLYPQRP